VPGGDPFAAVEVGDRARHPQQTVVRAPRQPEPVHRSLEQAAAVGIRLRHAQEGGARQVGVGQHAGEGRSRLLPPPGAADTARHRRGRLPGQARHVGVGQGGHVHVQIDPVQQRSRDARLIGPHASRRARAAPARISQAPAGAGVHRRDELKASRQADPAAHPRHGDLPVFEGLAQRLEDVALELGQLVQEEHAIVGEADFSGPRDRAASDDGGIACGVMGAAEGPLGEKRIEARAARGVDGRRLERLLGSERGKDARKPPGEHRLAGARRPGEEQVVASRGGDLERAAREDLAAHVGQVGQRSLRAQDGQRCGRIGPVGAAGQAYGVGKRADGIDAQPRDERGLGRVLGRDDRGRQAPCPGREHHRQDAGDRPDGPVERQLPHEEHVGQRRRAERTVGREQADRRGEVVGRAHLPKARGRHAHRDAAVPLERVAAVAQGGTDASLAFLDRGVGEAQHRELGESGCGVGFDADEVGVDTHHRRGQ